MTRRHCQPCCPRDCTIFEDELNRASIGSSWDVVSGTWQMVTSGGRYVLEETGSTDAVILSTTPHPVMTPTGWVYGTIHNCQNGRAYRLIINYDYDDGSYLFLEFEPTSDNAGDLKLCSYDGVSTTVLATSSGAGYTAGGTREMTICRTLTGMYGYFEEHNPHLYACVSGYDGRYAGFGNGAAETIQWEYFRFEEHTYTLPEELCGACGCECGGEAPDWVGECMPKTLTWTIIASDDCACADGTTGTMTFDPTADPEFWASDGPVQVSGCSTYEFSLTCDSVDGVRNFILCDKSSEPCGSWSETCETDEVGGYADGISCDPITLTYEPTGCFPASAEDPNCNMKIVVTA